MSICEKCGYESEDNKEVEGKILCQICRQFAPDKDKLEEYINEKINWHVLETFRRFSNKEKLKQGMSDKAKEGKIMNRAAFGYKIENKQLVPDEEKKLIVQKIFMDFLEEKASLNSLAKKYNFSVNGIKKILKNFTYLGKVKFSGQILQGTHQPIISSELFNKVQKKLENSRIN